MRKNKRKDLDPIPYTDKESLIARAFRMCLKGTTVDSLVAEARVMGGDPRFLLRRLRRGTQGDKRWRYLETDGRVKIEYPV